MTDTNFVHAYPFVVVIIVLLMFAIWATRKG